MNKQQTNQKHNDRFKQRLETIERNYALQVNALAERFFASRQAIGMIVK